MSVEVSKGTFIRRIRLENGVRAVKVCEDVLISEATFYAMEGGTRGITPRIALELMKSIGIDDKYRRFLLYPIDILERDVITRGEFVKLKRLDSGENITSLAEKIDVSVSILSCIEKGTRRVSKKVFPKLAQVFGLEGITYEQFYSNDFKVRVIYRIDEFYKVPIIDGLYVQEEEYECRLKQLQSEDGELWYTKEYELVSENYGKKEIEERKVGR